MNANDTFHVVLFIVVLIAVAIPLGRHMAAVFEGRSVMVRKIGRPVERLLYRIAGVDPQAGMSWRQYALAVLLFNVTGALAVYAILRLQPWLPANPQRFGPMTPDAAFNTAVSFATNTNWQNYSGESALSDVSQMVALAVQNFLSAATGIAVAIAVIRGFARHTAQTIGNFWVDLTRTTLYVLLPIATVFALFLVSQGVIQNFDGYRNVPTLQATTFQTQKTDAHGKPVAQQAKADRQTLPMGPVASQEAIKMLGTNGGGFFNANSAHPYENPTPLSNFVQMIAMLSIGAGLCVTFGQMVGDRRQGYAVLAAMTVAFALACWGEIAAEQAGNPLLASLRVDQDAGSMQAGGNQEGKEVRFGIADSGIFTVATTSASCGAVDTMHDSLTPLGGLVPLFMMQLGEVIFGGVGSGLYSMLAFALLGVFIAGLMIGRTPEYIGKKIDAYDMKMVSISLLVMPLIALTGTSIGVATSAGTAGIANPGTHGFSEILYAFTSAANNNGSAFAGLSVDTPFYNWATGIAMWFGRFVPIVALLAVAGSLAAKKRLAATDGTLPTHGPLFVALLLGSVLLIGALTFVPALALGPVAEHLQMLAGH